MLSWVGNMIFGSKPEDKLLEIPSGQLYLLDPSHPVTVARRTLKYKDASLTLRSTGEPFHYQLVVTRVYEEGEEELEDSLDQDEIAMLIHESLMFRRTNAMDASDKRMAFVWVDVQNTETLSGFEFVLDEEVPVKAAEAFQQAVYRCMFERMQKRAVTDDESLDQFVSQMKQLAETVDLTPRVTTLNATPRKTLTKETLATPRKQTTAQDASLVATDQSFASHVPQGDAKVNVPGQLYLYDIRTNQFVLMKESITAQILSAEPFAYTLLVLDPSPFLCQPIESRMNPIFNEEHESFLWVWNDETTGNPLYSWSIKFATEGYQEFKLAFGQAMYESLNRDTFLKVKEEDMDYYMNAYTEDVDRMDIDEPSEDEEVEEEDKKLRNTVRPDSDDEPDDFNQPGQSRNSQLAVGFNHNRSFVVRGNKIGVFKQGEDDDLEHVTTIHDVGTSKGAYFSPRKVMLHEQDRSMLLMKPNDEHNIYRMDLEYGKVVEEWKVHDIIPVDDIVPDAKYAQKTANQTLIGYNHNSLYRIDPRLAGDKLVESERKQYSRNYHFSCASTTDRGEVALANAKGEIRLYDKLSKEAKTLFPGLGDPILGIDTTADGKWIVATCKTYLLLLGTEIKGSGGELGFRKKMAQDKRPVPKRLQLKPEHVAMLGVPVSFTCAKFNTGEERTIVTSTGPFVITWNFRRVKQGRLYDYSIKRYADDVVADNFMFGEDKNIIVTLPENVEMVSKSTLSTPARLLKKGVRESVVNSPF